MGLSVKNAELERRVRELAARRGLGITKALRLAVDNELARDERPRRNLEVMRDAVREIQHRFAARGGLASMAEFDAETYGADGLPR